MKNPTVSGLLLLAEEILHHLKCINSVNSGINYQTQQVNAWFLNHQQDQPKQCTIIGEIPTKSPCICSVKCLIPLKIDPIEWPLFIHPFISPNHLPQILQRGEIFANCCAKPLDVCTFLHPHFAIYFSFHWCSDSAGYSVTMGYPTISHMKGWFIL